MTGSLKRTDTQQKEQEQDRSPDSHQKHFLIAHLLLTGTRCEEESWSACPLPLFDIKILEVEESSRQEFSKGRFDIIFRGSDNPWLY